MAVYYRILKPGINGQLAVDAVVRQSGENAMVAACRALGIEPPANGIQWLKEVPEWLWQQAGSKAFLRQETPMHGGANASGAVFIAVGFTPEETFSTVAHECCHLWQWQTGKMSKLRGANDAATIEQCEREADHFAQSLLGHVLSPPAPVTYAVRSGQVFAMHGGKVIAARSL